MMQVVVGGFLGFLIGKLYTSKDNSVYVPSDKEFSITRKSGIAEYKGKDGESLYDTFSFDFIKNDKLYSKIEKIYGR
jgi:hypothetical protein